MDGNPKWLARISWEGDSREVLAGFPDDVRADLGFALYELQEGKRPAISIRRMESIGRGVYELKTSDQRTWYRVIYLSKIDDVVYVLHCFEKDIRKTDRRDLSTAKQRFARVRDRLRMQRENAKQG